MLLIALALLPLYLVALGLLLLFYQKFHVWKKEGVSVGFVYDKSPEVKTNISSFLWPYLTKVMDHTFSKMSVFKHIPQKALLIGGSNSVEERICWQLDVTCSTSST